MTAARKRVAILISGRGSNMRSLVEASRKPGYPADIAAVISNRPDAAGIAWAQAQGLAVAVVDHRAYSTKAAFEDVLQSTLDTAHVDLVALAGFMRLLTPAFVTVWHNRLINIHPSLLPAYRGLNTHARALADGVRVAGCTVHFVRAETDTGPIVAQAAVPVLSADTPDTLGERVLAAEHRLYPASLALLSSGRAYVLDDKVVIERDVNQKSALFSPAL